MSRTRISAATCARRACGGSSKATPRPAAKRCPGLGGDFAYLRTRRIPAGRLLEIEHAQVYFWQPQALRQHVRASRVSHLPIPETLARRFGLHHGGKACG